MNLSDRKEPLEGRNRERERKRETEVKGKWWKMEQCLFAS